MGSPSRSASSKSTMPRAGAHPRVPPQAAALDRLEDEARAARVAQAQVGAERGEEVGVDRGASAHGRMRRGAPPGTKKTSAEAFVSGEVGLSSRSSARSRIARRPTTRSRTVQRTWKDPSGTRRRLASRPFQTPRGAASSSTARMRSRIERMPTTLPPSTTGRCRKPPWIISTAACSVVSSGSIVSGCARHEVADRGAVDLTARHCAQHVPLGEHALEPAARRARGRPRRSARPSPARPRRPASRRSP